MSTYWYFECLDHNPPLQSSEEFTQHTEDRHYQRAIELVSQRPIAAEDIWVNDGTTEESRSDTYFGNNARSWLFAHPTCEIGFVNEYGGRASVSSGVVGRTEQE